MNFLGGKLREVHTTHNYEYSDPKWNRFFRSVFIHRLQAFYGSQEPRDLSSADEKRSAVKTECLGEKFVFPLFVVLSVLSLLLYVLAVVS